jgi:hypothetical protein
MGSTGVGLRLGLRGAFTVFLPWVLNKCLKSIGSSCGIYCKHSTPSSKTAIIFATTCSGGVE